jgi:hypothetical protein
VFDREGVTTLRLRSSLLEMQGRLLEMRGDDGDDGCYLSAMECMRQAIGIDRKLGTIGARGLGIHLRMGANIGWKIASAGLLADLSDVPRWADESVEIGGDDVNLGRAEMVVAKVYGTPRTVTKALRAHAEARRLLGEDNAGPYERELREIEARLASVCGRVDEAIEKWRALMDRAAEYGHPSLQFYSREIAELQKRTPAGRLLGFLRGGPRNTRR